MTTSGRQIDGDKLSRTDKLIFFALGTMNLAFAAGGLAVLAFQSWAISIFPSQVIGEAGSTIRGALHSGQVAAAILLIPLAYVGIQLLQLRRRGIVICQVVFILELGYVAITGYIWPWIFYPQFTSAVRGGFLNAGIAIQMVMGYPVIGILILYFLHRRQLAAPKKAKPLDGSS